MNCRCSTRERGFPIIVFALIVCALDFGLEVKYGQSLFHGCFGLAGFYQYVMDQYGSSSGNGAYTGSAQDAQSSPATHPALPTTNDPASVVGVGDFVYKAEWRETDTGERVRVRKLTNKEVKRRDLETAKQGISGGSTDDIYEEARPREGTTKRRLWVGRGTGPLQLLDDSNLDNS